MATTYHHSDGYGRYDDEERGTSGEMETSYSSTTTSMVPDSVKEYVTVLYRLIREQDVAGIHELVETNWYQLTDRYFKASAWPSAESVAKYVDNDQVFLILYQELVYRHVYASLAPSFVNRYESFENYQRLFSVILNSSVTMMLPNQWLYNMLDEFVYQMQSFCQFRSKLEQRTEEELYWLQQNPELWNVLGVLQVLQLLVDKSGILKILAQDREAFESSEGYDYKGQSNVLRMLGYFSLTSLLRVHTLIGDYRTALKIVEPLMLGKVGGIYERIPTCFITLHYYAGFCHLMQRQYGRAINLFNSALVYVARNKPHLMKLPQADQITKKNEQMMALLAVSLGLCPAPRMVDDGVMTSLRDTYGEHLNRLQRGDRVIFDDLFSFACPKFVTPAFIPPQQGEPLISYNQAAYQLQVGLFMNEVEQHGHFAAVRGFLQLYTSLTLTKLAQLLGTDEQTARLLLLGLKRKTEEAKEGEPNFQPDVDFYIDEDVVHVTDTKVKKLFGDYFIRHITKAEEVMSELRSLQAVG